MEHQHLQPSSPRLSSLWTVAPVDLVIPSISPVALKNAGHACCELPLGKAHKPLAEHVLRVHVLHEDRIQTWQIRAVVDGRARVVLAQSDVPPLLILERLLSMAGPVHAAKASSADQFTAPTTLSPIAGIHPLLRRPAWQYAKKMPVDVRT